MNIALIAGTRPNFIKAAPLRQALQKISGVRVRLIHTGQHSDAEMSAAFFDDLKLSEPDIVLEGRGQTVIQETARISRGLEPVLKKIQPDWVVVIGDVTSTLAGALAAKQMGFPLAHVEAGLRSGDRRMPEEINRIVVDHLADVLFASEESGVVNLQREGIPEERIHFSGNVLIDALHGVLPQAASLKIPAILARASICPSGQAAPLEYALCTFHRPSNVDEPEHLKKLFELVSGISRNLPLVFPLHPRTSRAIKDNKMEKALRLFPKTWILPPLCYSEMICLLKNAALVVTDSGGLQEESTWLDIPCLTFRKSTERPATVIYGTNTIIADRDVRAVERQIEVILAGKYKRGTVPPLWDGRAAGRIANILAKR